MAESDAKTVEKLNKAFVKANSGQDKNETALLMMSPSINWSEFLTPAPMSIALLGQLMLISTEKDFSLEKQKPEHGFKFMEHPGSFRASLVQVSNAGWGAFNEAHKNMDAIRLYSAQVPIYVKKVVHTLVKGTEEDVKDFLPIELKKIERASDECLALAKAVETKFEDVMNLTGEILQVSSEAKGYYEKEQEELKMKRDLALIKEESARKEAAAVKEQQEKLEKQVREAKQGFEKAVDSMPSGWDLVGMQFVETLTNVAANTASTVLPALAASRGIVPAVPSVNPYTPDLEVGHKTEQVQTVASAGAAFNEGTKLKELVIKLVEYLDSAAKGSKDEKGSDDEESLTNKLQTTRIMMEGLENDFSDKKTLGLLKKAIDICKEAEKLTDEFTYKASEMNPVAKKAKQLKKSVNKLCTKAQAKSGGTPFYTRPPRQAQATNSSASNASSSATKAAVESARFRITEARGLLERQENRYDQACSELKESEDKITKVLLELAEFSPEKIANFDEIRKTLRLGMEALASLREKWQKLVDFFQFVTNIIKVCQKESLSSFVEYAKVGQKRALANGYAGTDFMRDFIYEQVNQANTTSFVVWSISNMYVEISRNHLMGRLASLGHLIALDPEKDRAEIQKKRSELMEGSQEAQDAIKKLVLEAQDQFHEKIVKRIEQIETELVKALPPEDPARIKEIKDTVNQAIKEADNDDELSADAF